MPVTNESNGIWRILTILSFGMLLLLTLASKPVEKLSVALTTKYEKQAQKKICNILYSKQELYMHLTRNLWMGACMWTTYGLQEQLLINSRRNKRLEQLHKQWQEQEGPLYKVIEDMCGAAYAQTAQDAVLEDKIIGNLHSSFGCKDIKEEEVHEDGN